MHLLGNDIVALDEPGVRNKSQDKRFLERVFTPLEQQWILFNPQPDRALWSLWAAKEATYKALARYHHDIIFAHSSFVVEPTRQDSDGTLLWARISHGAYCLGCSFLHGDQWVHAMVARGQKYNVTSLGTQTGDQSIAVRDRAVNLAHCLGVSAVVTGRPPILIDSTGKTIDCLVSLSHDGSWSAATLGWHL